MSDSVSLVPAEQLARKNTAHWPGETAEYRAARNALLVREIELRRLLESLAEERRALPAGGEVPTDFEFTGEQGTVRFSELFGNKDTLMVYSMMFGPQRKAPCPMCTPYLHSWNGTAVNLRERVAIAVTARSPIERLLTFKQERGLSDLSFFSDVSGDYTRTYVHPDDADVPGFSVFVRRDGKIRHFYSGEMSGAMADPEQDPRGAPDIDPLWLMLDLTPEGRGGKWYPKLQYGNS